MDGLETFILGAMEDPMGLGPMGPGLGPGLGPMAPPGGVSGPKALSGNASCLREPMNQPYHIISYIYIIIIYNI